MPSSPRRRTVAATSLATAGLLAALTGLGAVAPAAAAPTAGEVAAAQTVTEGDARFQVLSPTLIRTEFAPGGAFTDAATFNVVGRDSFAATRFTTTRDDGWLTIDTGEARVRYEIGSGSFDQGNLELSLTTGSGQQVVAAPWQQDDPARCVVGVRCEAETLDLVGLAPATNHTGATGDGFVAGFERVGDAASFSVTAEQAGPHDLVLRYANSQGGDGQVTTRTLSVTVDGGAAQTISLPPTAGWDDWALARATLDLAEGEHDVVVERASGDSGNLNLDGVAVVEPGGAYPAEAPAAVETVDCAYGAPCEAETTALAGGASVGDDHDGASAEAFAAGLGRGASFTAHVTGVPAGEHVLQIRYASAQPDARTVSVSTGAGTVTTASLEPTSGWDHWRTVSVPVTLSEGEDDVTVGCPDDASCQLNVDTVAVASAAAPLLAPHAALGGYRRDLDTANGTVDTNAGLLYQDGWSLVDDSASAQYDEATETLTPRPVADVQDGYLFAAGDAHETALGDLATLTGPSVLLPRWAYGVWYSEYYDRTQSDFTDTIVPRFAEEGVPLDVLAVDTDYKAPDKWNGWEVDETRFPDMAGFLAGLEEQGVHNTLNVHPSITQGDPQLPAAQATAQGNLIPDGERFLFDWSDPAQLQAYFDLHDEIADQGVDVFWLDWCCSDASRYSQPGVTPDAFINDQYAQRTADRIGRGFAFSRAYGALTAGGYGNPQPVPTGPWADKRTTLHFTGDTTSTWQMLQAQVGYTPGESAATGLSAISHDIGGHTGGTTFPGAEAESTKLADDLYARWVQFGTFQPIDRLHSNHSDRLPWQYPAPANASAKQFLNLREDLVPLTYTLAAQATKTGTPILQPLYLQYPEAQESYAQAGSEYLYGKDVLVAPVTTANDAGTGTATRSVWFPAGSSWTDWFTGKTYAGGTTADVTTGLDSMPVFVRSGGIVPTRSQHVANDAAPLDAVSLTVATGADGAFDLYEDAGEDTTTTAGVTAEAAAGSASTAVRYTQQATGGTLDVAPVDGTFAGQVRDRSWTATFTDADRPETVTVDGRAVADTEWTYDAATRTISVPVAERSVSERTVVRFSTVAAATPTLQVTDPEVTAGTAQTVTGSGFPADTDVVLATTPDIGGTTTHTDADGAFSADLAVPSSASGRVTVTASVGDTVLARAAFTVTPTAAGPSPAPTTPPTTAPGTSPGTSPSTSPGASPGAGTPGGTGSAGGDGAGPAAPGTDAAGDRDGDLAWTGAELLPLALLAAGLLAAGGVVLTMRRRRRARG